MPFEAERISHSVDFTSEAEGALEREVGRFERRLRARAVEASIRARGFPAEVTGTDVMRASKTLSQLRSSESEDDESLRGAFHSEVLESRHAMRRARELAQREVIENLTKRRPIHRLLTIYAWLGVVTSIVGILYALLHDQVVYMSHNPLWRQAIAISGIGLMLAVVGFACRSWISRRIESRLKTR